jgi:serine/threonine-protein kinase ULK/ATG1
MIAKESFDFPRTINNISDMSKTLIRKMLKANPKERMSWEELFQHEVNRYIEKKMEKELSLTLTMDGSLSENVCKLYLNQNLVIIHPS